MAETSDSANQALDQDVATDELTTRDEGKSQTVGEPKGSEGLVQTDATVREARTGGTVQRGSQVQQSSSVEEEVAAGFDADSSEVATDVDGFGEAGDTPTDFAPEVTGFAGRSGRDAGGGDAGRSGGGDGDDDGRGGTSGADAGGSGSQFFDPAVGADVGDAGAAAGRGDGGNRDGAAAGTEGGEGADGEGEAEAEAEVEIVEALTPDLGLELETEPVTEPEVVELAPVAEAAAAERSEVVAEIVAPDVAETPKLAVEAASGAEDSAIALDIAATLTDLDGSEALSITIENVPTGASLSAGTDNGDGTWSLNTADLDGLTITPAADSNADFQLNVIATATEADGDTATTNSTLDVGVTGVADTPSLSVSAASGAEDSAISLDITSALTVLDGSESLSITIENVPTGATLSAGTDNLDGTWSLEPADLDGLTITRAADSNADFSLNVVATATENDGDTTTASTALNVSVSGVADTPSLSVSAASGAEDSAIALDVTSALTDLDGSESLSITIENVPTGASLSAGTDNLDGTWSLEPADLDGLTITPPADSNADFSLNVVATATENDGDTTTASTALNVSVSDVADTPSLSVSAASGAEDSAIALDVTSALTDLGGSESLSITIENVPTGASLSAGTDNLDGTWSLEVADLDGLTITPAADSNADFQLNVIATATEADGDTTTASTALNVSVTGVADTPTLTTAAASGAEDSAIALDITSALSDLDGSESLSITIENVPTGASLSAGTDNLDGTWSLDAADLDGLTITPPADSNADFQLNVVATATENDGSVASTSATLDVSVSGVADAPTLSVSAASGAEDSAIALDITSALTDLDGSESLSITIENVPTGASLSAGTDNLDGTWSLDAADLDGLTITPPADSNADFSLNVVATATEADGDTTTASTALNVSVSGVADTPSLSVSAASGAEDSAIALDITSALTDLDGSESLSITVENVPTSATLDVGVTGVADAPTLSVSAASGAEDSAIALDVTSALTDLDGSEALSITIENVPTGATLSAGTDNLDGSWSLEAADLDGLTITPPADSNADFSLNVVATATENDGDTATTSTALNVSVTGVADTPSLSVSAASGAEDSAISLDITSALTDLDGSESLSITIENVPTGASLSAGTDNLDGTWSLDTADLDGLTITPPADSNADFQLNVVATATENDGDTATTSTTLDVSVSGVADTPTLTTSAASGAEDSAISQG